MSSLGGIGSSAPTIAPTPTAFEYPAKTAHHLPSLRCCLPGEWAGACGLNTASYKLCRICRSFRPSGVQRHKPACEHQRGATGVAAGWGDSLSVTHLFMLRNPLSRNAWAHCSPPACSGMNPTKSEIRCTSVSENVFSTNACPNSDGIAITSRPVMRCRHLQTVLWKMLETRYTKCNP